MVAKELVSVKGKARRAARRTQRNRDSQALQRIHGKIQANPEPPKRGDYEDFHEGYKVSVSWTEPPKSVERKRPGSSIVTILVYDSSNGERVGTCEFLFQEAGQLAFGREQLARFESLGWRMNR